MPGPFYRSNVRGLLQAQPHTYIHIDMHTCAYMYICLYSHVQLQMLTNPSAKHLHAKTGQLPLAPFSKISVKQNIRHIRSSVLHSLPHTVTADLSSQAPSPSMGPVHTPEPQQHLPTALSSLGTVDAHQLRSPHWELGLSSYLCWEHPQELHRARPAMPGSLAPQSPSSRRQRSPHWHPSILLELSIWEGKK